MKKVIFLPLLLLICQLTLTAQQYQKTLNDIVSYNDIPGLQLAYTINGKTTCYNSGAEKSGSGKKITSNTIFRAGSLGKTVLAYATMRLYDRQVIDLDKPLLNYMDTYDRFETNDSRFAKITARMVLSHTSGLEFMADPKAKLLANPGTVFSYSSEGFYFLQKAIEKICGKPLEDIMQQEVFKPLKMPGSTFIKRESFNTAMLGSDDFEPNAAFTLFTNATDYNTFLQALVTGNGLKPATRAMMFAKQSNAQWLGKDTTATDAYIDWGLGVGLQQNEKGAAIWHWGSIMNFNSFYLAFPGAKCSLVYFTNSITGLRVANQVVNLFLGRQTTWAIPWLKFGYDQPETMLQLHNRVSKQGFKHLGTILKQLRGNGLPFSERDLEFFGSTLLKQKKAEQSLAVFGQTAKLYPQDAGIYNNLANAYLSLKNKPLALKYYQQSFAMDTSNTSVGYHIKALKNNTHLNTAQLKGFEGRYKLGVMDGIFMELKVNKNGLTMLVQGGNDSSVFVPVSANEFLNYETAFTLRFIKNSGGDITGVLIHTANTVDTWEKVKKEQ